MKQRFLPLILNVDFAVVSVIEVFCLQFLIYHSLLEAQANDM